MPGARRPAGQILQLRHRRTRIGHAAIALVRMHCHQPTKDYVTRRTAEGRTKKEILRCLKSYIARETYALLPGSGAPSESAACPDITAATPSSVANM
jgi:hypothetical protein